MGSSLSTVQRVLLISTLVAQASFAPQPAAAQGPAAPTPTPVFFAPLKLPKAMRRHELSLRRLLTARLLATGKFSAAVAAETEQAIQECVRQVNQDANAEQCWVRIGQGQGAEMMVAGDVLGDKRSCDLTLELTMLETRVSPRMHVKHLEPCGPTELRAEMAVAAAVLAGQRAAPVTEYAPAATSGGGLAALPPPPSGTPSGSGASGPAPPPPAATVGSLSVTGSPKGARVDVEGPLAFNRGKPLATSLPLFPPRTVPAGEYKVRVTAPEYDPFEETRVIPAVGIWAVEAKLVPSIATLVVSGEPAGASATIRCGPGLSQRPLNLPRGRDAFGLTKEDFSFKVPKGRCVVKASFVGWQDFEEEVTLAGGERKRVRVKLTQQPKGGAQGQHGINWVRLPGGRFRMGSEGGAKDERPVHEVRLPAFEIMETEVTVAMWRACVRARACKPADTCTWGKPNWKRSGVDDHPINCVSWAQAQVFARWVGNGARLCSEAEWEYAARSGGTDSVYPWGNERASCDRAVMDDGGKGCGHGKTTWPVCSKPKGSSTQGVCDLAGNVWEWVRRGSTTTG